jgi:outer membrane receptor protein involved in Fe transport
MLLKARSASIQTVEYIMRFSLFFSSCLASMIPLAAQAAEPEEKTDGDEDIVVTAQRLDKARDSISTSVGASQYTFNREALDVQPGGTDRSLKGVLLQAPGVAQDSDGDGDIHIRNEHGNVQYRLNGVVVPDGFAGFGAPVDPRIASSVQVITGALPAQYGYRTAGVVALTTRTDAFDLDGDIGIYGGGNGTIQPSATIRNSVGNLNYFGSISYLRNDLGISNPTPSRKAIHDRTEQYRGFGYLSYILNDKSRITAFGSSSTGRFQIPNAAGQTPNYRLNGRSTFDSALLDQNQQQQTHFGVLAWQYSDDGLDLQIAPFLRYAKARYTPDPAGGQLLFNGADTRLTQDSLAYGAQADASKKAGDAHTIRFGLYYQHERTGLDSLNRVFRVNALGVQTSDIPLSIAVAQRKNGETIGVYLQDEWKVSDTLTFNYGLRYDRSRAFVSEQQLSPRAGLVWTPGDGTTIHAGYARNFTPPPQQIVTNATLTAFAGTTGAPETTQADPVRAEREHSFDIGAQQIIGGYLTLGVDLYYKIKRNLLDEEHFGSTLIESPFNYARAKTWGAELSATYQNGPADAYFNISRGAQKAQEIVSNQFFFGDDELDYIRDHYIYTDHSQAWTLSGGAATKFATPWGKLIPAFDFIYGDGLRAGDPAGIIPNGGKQKPYLQVNFGLAHSFGTGEDAEEKGLTVRVDVVNLFDKIYLIHDGSGVGAGQPEYGPRRAFFIGLRKGF